MSQRYFRSYTGKHADSRLEESPVEPATPVQIQAGWDRPLSCLHLTILMLDGIRGRDVETLFTNTDMDDPSGLTISAIKRYLRNYAIRWPEEWLRDVRNDAIWAAKIAGKPSIESRAGNSTSEFGVIESLTFQERLQMELDRTPGLKDALESYLQVGVVNAGPPIMGALVRLGILGTDDGRLAEAVLEITS